MVEVRDVIFMIPNMRESGETARTSREHRQYPQQRQEALELVLAGFLLVGRRLFIFSELSCSDDQRDKQPAPTLLLVPLALGTLTTTVQLSAQTWISSSYSSASMHVQELLLG
jgi:hypothetical protein